MPILRAGPWGNLSDSFQNVPVDTGADDLTIYPVNCAKTNWASGQAWGAYYEVYGCCTPATVNITGAILSTMTRRDIYCDYEADYIGTPPTYTDQYYQLLTYFKNSGTWNLYWQGYRAYGDAYLTNNDPCDPTGTYVNYYGGNPIVSTP